MKDQSSPTGASASNRASTRLLPSSIALSLAFGGEIAKAQIIRDSFGLDLRVSGRERTQDISCSNGFPSTSYILADLEVPTFGIDDEISRLTESLRFSLEGKSFTESLPTDTKDGPSSQLILTGGTRRMGPAEPPSTNMSYIEPPIATSIRPRILVVDDEILYSELIADILGDEYEMLLAANGNDALEIAGIRAPHLILLDVMMPGIDGYEVHKRLKADFRTCEIPVIFISGLGEVADETKALTLGAVDYITKPINSESVRARVKRQIALKLAQDKLIQLAETDGLTGLANRSHFDKMLAYECARHLRSGHELSLIMLDIDHFKAFNDTFGHVRGDECLRKIAQAMARTVLRATDLLARYGGEEFVVLLPETPLKGAVLLAERIRNCITDLKLPHPGSNLQTVTASLGVVSGRLLTTNSVSDVVQGADIELYAAKAAGRNCVSFRAIDRFGLAH